MRRKKNASFSLKTSPIDVVHYLPYLPLPEGLKLAGLKADADINGEFSYPEAGPVLKLAGTAALSEADIQDDGGAPLAGFSRLGMTLKVSDVLAGRIDLDKGALDDLFLALSRDETGC